jgi:hypothetical protein
LGDTPEQVFAAFAYLNPSHAEVFLQAMMPDPQNRPLVRHRKLSRS